MNRVALSLAPSKQIDLDNLVRLVLVAEDTGYDSVWLPETWGYDAVSLLAVLARETSRIRLGAGVLNVYSRSAAAIAQTALTLQNLSHGRFILGLGASGPIVVQDWHSTKYVRPLQRTQEYVEAIRAALSGDRVNYPGEQVRMQGFRLSALPAATVPIFLAALGPRNVRLAGRIADGWLPIFAPRGRLGPLFNELAAGAQEAGRDPASIEVAAYVPALVGPRADRLLRQQLVYYIGGMGTFYARYLAGMGFSDEVATIRSLWQEGSRVAAVNLVGDDLLSLCTLGAEPTEAHRRLLEYRQEGISLPVVTLPTGCTSKEAEQTVRALAPRL